jgi:hypothetical protein
VSGSAIFAGIYDGGVYLSTDNGASWTPVNTGLTDFNVVSLAVSDGALFAGTYEAGVWSSPLSGIGVTGVTNPEPRQAMSNQGNLRISSPGHGGSDAIIEFSLPHSDRVTVAIYNLSGHQIASLVNQNLGQGGHSIPWNTRNLAAGRYTVRMQAGANTYVKSISIFR